jgi:hypothetical protein
MTIMALFLSGHDGVTGLTPSIVIMRDDTAVVVASGTMTDVGSGRYKYEYAETAEVPYSFICDGGETLEAAQRIKAGSFCASAGWATIIEGAVTALEALRTILDTAIANTEGFPGTPKIKNLAGTKNRVEADLDIYGNRTRTALDVTE